MLLAVRKRIHQLEAFKQQTYEYMASMEDSIHFPTIRPLIEQQLQVIEQELQFMRRKTLNSNENLPNENFSNGNLSNNYF